MTRQPASAAARISVFLRKISCSSYPCSLPSTEKHNRTLFKNKAVRRPPQCSAPYSPRISVLLGSSLILIQSYAFFFFIFILKKGGNRWAKGLEALDAQAVTSPRPAALQQLRHHLRGLAFSWANFLVSSVIFLLFLAFVRDTRGRPVHIWTPGSKPPRGGV